MTTANFGQVQRTIHFFMWAPEYGRYDLGTQDVASTLKRVKSLKLRGDWSLWASRSPATDRLIAVVTGGTMLVFDHDLMEQVTT